MKQCMSNLVFCFWKDNKYLEVEMVITKVRDGFTISTLLHTNMIFFLDRVNKFELGWQIYISVGHITNSLNSYRQNGEIWPTLDSILEVEWLCWYSLTDGICREVSSGLWMTLS